jgi:ribokinase
VTATGPTVVVVGSLNMDLLVRVPTLPRPGETVSGTALEHSCGGKGANQAVAARRLGADVRLVGVVGTDAFGGTLLERLHAERVDASDVTRSSTAPTGVALIVVDADGENMITLAPGANHELTGDRLERLGSALSGADALLVQLEVPVTAVLAAAHAAKQAGVPVVLNAAPLPSTVTAKLRELLRCTDVLVVNETEAAGLAGALADELPDELPGGPPGGVAGAGGRPGDHVATAVALRRLGPAEVVLTLGAHGAVAADSDGAHRVEAFTVDAVDTVGAGDAFCAALATARASGAGLVAATRWACAAGALAATRPGAQDAMPVHAEVQQLFTAASGQPAGKVDVDAH